MFDEHRVRKYSEWLERQSIETAEELICEHFAVESVYELTQDQVRAVIRFRDTMNDHDPLLYGFGEVIYNWESENNLELL